VVCCSLMWSPRRADEVEAPPPPRKDLEPLTLEEYERAPTFIKLQVSTLKLPHSTSVLDG
jgi:hypothetical protein